MQLNLNFEVPESSPLAPQKLIAVQSGEVLQYLDSMDMSGTSKPEYIHNYKYLYQAKRYVSFTHANLLQYLEKGILK